ncbi:hypothetical protein I7I50_02578 [Histoplasma capsulatum G186AR]|nr:hypothetical protein I7I52_00759 [Histoplasma capsulatum]QSS71654.1 hypothetical protein I7I50_02578 [Histoplasma capsulatum G186AR]
MSLSRRRRRPGASWRCPKPEPVLASSFSFSMSLTTCILLAVLWLPFASAMAPGAPGAPGAIAMPSAISRIHYLLIANNNLGRDLRKIVVDPHSPSLLPRAGGEAPVQHQRDSAANTEGDEGDDKDNESPSTSPSKHPINTKTASVSPEATTTTSTSSPSQTETTKPTKTGSNTEKTQSPTLTSSDDTPFPSPFDSNLGSNFTGPACEGFFHSFLGNSTFQNCLPLSLLIESSLSFFHTSRSVVRLARLLDAACSVPRDSCSALMSELDRKLVSEDICGKDLKLEQPVVIQAHNGLRSYGTVHDATCLKNPDTDNYCFSDAITNTSNPSNSYVYFLPLNMALPGSSRPTCNKCLQATMQTFSLAATNDNQPISKTYLAAAQQINIGCGPSFVVAAVKLGSSNVARRTVQLVTGPSMFGFDLVGVMAYVLLFCVGIPIFGNIL